jgi:hypothetical protein
LEALDGERVHVGSIGLAQGLALPLFGGEEDGRAPQGAAVPRGC